MFLRRYYYHRIRGYQRLAKAITSGVAAALLLWGVFTVGNIPKSYLLPLSVITAAAVTLIVFIRSGKRRSFYFLSSPERIVFTTGEKEIVWKFSDITAIELLTDLDIVFSVRKVVITHREKKTKTIVMKQDWALLFSLWFEKKLNEQEKKFVDDLHGFLEKYGT